MPTSAIVRIGHFHCYETCCIGNRVDFPLLPCAICSFHQHLKPYRDLLLQAMDGITGNTPQKIVQFAQNDSAHDANRQRAGIFFSRLGNTSPLEHSAT
jgi:hypothetical protein